MNKVVIISLLMSVISPVAVAVAYTSCPNQTLTEVFADGSHTYLGINGGLKGQILSSRLDYKTMVSIALSARISDKKVTIRYKNDGVTCGAAAWNEEISGIGI
jgi:hexokinase